MKKSSGIFYLLILFSFISCHENPFDTDNDRGMLSPEEYQVINTILPKADTTIILYSNTGSGDYFVNEFDYDLESRYYRKDANVILDRDMITDFLEKSKIPAKIEKRKLENKNITLIDQNNVRGTHFISRVGFDKNHDKAFVYFEYYGGVWAGYGGTCYLEKIGPRWAIIASLIQWMS